MPCPIAAALGQSPAALITAGLLCDLCLKGQLAPCAESSDLSTSPRPRSWNPHSPRVSQSAVANPTCPLLLRVSHLVLEHAWKGTLGWTGSQLLGLLC